MARLNPCMVCREPHVGTKVSVCHNCIRKVAEYDNMRAKLHAGQVEIRLRDSPYVPGRDFHGKNRRGQLDLLLQNMRRSLSETGYGQREEHAPKFEGEITDPVLKLFDGARERSYNAPANLAQFLIDLEHRIYQAVNEAKEEGIKEGTNLLAQLAAGNLTTDDFERKAGIVPKGP